METIAVAAEHDVSTAAFPSRPLLGTWSATLLDEPPVSGSVPEVHFDLGPNGGDWCWALFEKADDVGLDAWAGCFRRDGGMSRRDLALAVALTEDAVVLAGDLLYWVSLRDRSIRYTDPHALEVRGVPGRPIVAVAGYHEVRLISSAGILWRRELISCDPITLTDSTHDRVTGIVESLDGRVPFEIDLESMQLKGGIGPAEDAW